MTIQLLRRVWGSIEEPRYVTVTMIAAYLANLAAGVSLAFRPLLLLVSPVDWPMRTVAVGLMILTGMGGIIPAWTGRWWLERGVAGFAALAWGLNLSQIIVATAYGHLTMPVLSATGALLACLLFFTRFLRTKEAPYAPGRGPQLAETITKKEIQALRYRAAG